MSKIMPPMSNVKTRAIRKSRKNSFTGRGFYHTQLAVGKSLVLNDQSDRGGGALGAHSHIQKHASHPDDRRPSKFIVLADNMKSAINKAWEHGGADFQPRFDKSTAQAQEESGGATGFVILLEALAVLELGTPITWNAPDDRIYVLP